MISLLVAMRLKRYWLLEVLWMTNLGMLIGTPLVLLVRVPGFMGTGLVLSGYAIDVPVSATDSVSRLVLVDRVGEGGGSLPPLRRTRTWRNSLGVSGPRR